MRTQFGKSLIASGLIAAIGTAVAAASPAFAGHGSDYKRGHERADTQRYDNGPGRNERSYRSSSATKKQPAKPAYRSHPSQAPVKAQSHRPAVKVVHKQTVVKKKVVVRKNVGRSAPIVKTGYGYRHGYGNAYGAPPTRVIVAPERRRYRNIPVVRSYGHRYYGYGHHQDDRDAYRWLAFTAISVALINNMTEYQQRSYEDAQIRATSAPVGETIHWNNAGASGTVTATREGTSSLDRYCREFQKTVTIGGNTERAYGTACLQPDGAWEVIP